jgi:dTDP-glucose 4,6-dehydratase
MKHVIITGGSGFIGSHLCEVFLNQGYSVTAVDNLLTGREENLASFRSHPHFSFVKKDVCDPWRPDEFPLLAKDRLANDRLANDRLANDRLEGILHFACPASPVDFDRIPFEILSVDSIGTMNSVKFALQYGARYLLASTSEVYGDPLVHPQNESYWGNVNPNGPRACYDETKRFGEAYVSTATRLKA